jgi:Fe-S-cluster containining protein
MYSKVIKSLEKIYSTIPDFNCMHCHNCCGPIIWYEPEDILIRDYMKKHNIQRISWTMGEFKKNNMKCPYIKDDRCIIYPVRPIVCRLQGNISELKCKFSNKNQLVLKEKLEKLRKDYIKLIDFTNRKNVFYSTRRLLIKSDYEKNWKG